MSTHVPVHIQLVNNKNIRVSLTPAQHSDITGKSAVTIGVEYSKRKTNRLSNRQITGYDPMPVKGYKPPPSEKDKTIKQFFTKRLIGVSNA